MDSTRKRIHFSGIAGKGMAPAAALALQAGHQVSGDDLVSNHRIAPLREAGAEILIGRNINVPPNVDWHIKSGQTSTTNSGSRRTRLSVVADILAEARNSSFAVAGSVGKSTAAAICWAAHRTRNPSCYIGADVSGTLCGGHLNSNSLAVVEADEYKDAYLAISAEMLVLLNVYPNHEDYFGEGTAGFVNSFSRWFAEQPLRPTEAFVSVQAARELRRHGIRNNFNIVGSASTTDSDWTYEVTGRSNNSTTLRVGRGKPHIEFILPLTGDHAAFAAAVGIFSARAWGIPDTDIREGLSAASLPLRRQTLVHHAPAIWVYDDNARLPIQFETAVAALRQRHPGATIIAVISPWGRLNQRDLSQWAQAGASSDILCVLPVGAASITEGGAERPDAAASLVERVEKLGQRAIVVDEWEQLPTPTGETVYLTAGYDSQASLFQECHSYLREQ